MLERCGHVLMHVGGVVAFDEVRRLAVAANEGVEFFVRDAREDGRVGDLVAVEVKDREHGAVADGVEEFVGVPGGGERTGLGLAVADQHGDDQVGIVEGCAEGVRERVAELAAFVDRAGSFGRAVAADAAGEGEARNSVSMPFASWLLVGIDLGVVAFEIAVGERGGRAVAGAGDVDDVEVVLFDEAIEMDPDEGLAGVGAPVAEQAVLDVLGLERFAEQRVVAQDRSCRRRGSCTRASRRPCGAVRQE